MKCSIIGSFRKYYSEVIKAIDIFNENGFEVLSPKKSEIVKLINQFVILKTDKTEDPIEIQLITFNRIFRSDFIYVVNPKGYVGRTTCYELGKIEQRGIPIFYQELPCDLPIICPQSNIIPIKILVDTIQHIGCLPKEDLKNIPENILRLYNALFDKPEII